MNALKLAGMRRLKQMKKQVGSMNSRIGHCGNIEKDALDRYEPSYDKRLLGMLLPLA